MRIVKVVSLFLSLGVALLFAGGVFFLDQGVTLLLQRLGAADVDVQGVTLDFQQIHVARMTTVWNISGGGTVRTELHDASFQYDIKELLKRGRGRLLTIREVGVTLAQTETETKSGRESTLPEQIHLLKDRVRSSLPFEELEIDKLQLYGDFPTLLLGENIQVRAAVKETAIRATILLQSSAAKRSVLKIESFDSAHASATIGMETEEGENAELALVLSPGNLSGKIALDFETIRKVFVDHDIKNSISELNGYLSGTFDLSFTAEKRSVSVKAMVANFETPKISASSLEVQLAGRIGGSGLVIDNGSKILAKQIHLGTTEIEEFVADIAGSYQGLQNEIHLLFAESQRVSVKGLKTGTLQIQYFDVQLQNPLEVVGNTEKKSWSVTDNTLYSSSMQLEKGERRVESAPVYLSFSGLRKSSIESKPLLAVQTSTLLLDNGTRRLSLKELTGTVQQSGKRIEGDLQFAPQNVVGEVTLHFDYNIESSSGSFDLQTRESLELSPERGSLDTLMTPWDYPFNLDAGSVSFELYGRWGGSAPLQLSASVDLAGGSGYAQQFLFEGLDFSHDLRILPKLESKRSASVSLQHLIGGIDMDDIRADVNLGISKNGKQPLLRVDTFKASLFDGTVKTSQVVYDLNQPQSNFVVDIDSINLSSLVNLIQMKSLQVTGRVSGSIPVRIEGKQVHVSDGILQSGELGGEVRYQPGTMNQSGLTGYALKAVENLKYKTLVIKSEYAPSGQLDLEMSLQGTSPGLQSSRPVQLNIHAEQNLPALMQSLRFSKGLTEELDKRVKQHYN